MVYSAIADQQHQANPQTGGRIDRPIEQGHQARNAYTPQECEEFHGSVQPGAQILQEQGKVDLQRQTVSITSPGY